MMRKRQINILSLQTHAPPLMLSNLSPFNLFGLPVYYNLRTPRSWDLLVTWGGKADKPVCFYCKGIYLILYFIGFQLLYSNKCDKINKIIYTSPWNICRQGQRSRTVLLKNKNSALTMSFGGLFITHIILLPSCLSLFTFHSSFKFLLNFFISLTTSSTCLFQLINLIFFSSVIGSQKNWVKHTENPHIPLSIYMQVSLLSMPWHHSGSIVIISESSLVYYLIPKC